jgi:hypothetical protein
VKDKLQVESFCSSESGICGQQSALGCILCLYAQCLGNEWVIA